MQSRGLPSKHMKTIGFKTFQTYMENKIEQMFATALGPVMSNLRQMRHKNETREKELETEFHDTDPNRILSTTRDCGTSFATALSHVMEGVLNLSQGRMKLDAELTEFHEHHKQLGSDTFDLLPGDDFSGLTDYVDY